MSPLHAPARACWAAAALVATAAASAADLAVIEKQAEVCMTCHGPQGNSTDPAVPTLAGQPKQFITTQLVMFREGNRKNPPMLPFVEKLSNAQINDLGTYFSSQTMKRAGTPLAAEKDADGRQLVTRFQCVQCHGPALKGQQHIPRLAGQQPAYLKAQLQGFKAQTRFDMDGNMTSAAQVLQPPDIELISEYLSGLD